MEIQDKYGIQEAIDSHFTNLRVRDVSDQNFEFKSVSAIWEEVYIRMPLKDSGDRNINQLLEAIKSITGESSIKIELSCGLFQQQKLTLANGTWYLERAKEGYYILPEYRAGRRFLTRLDADLAADLILTFDKYIPKIYRRAGEELRRRKAIMMATELIKSTVLSIISNLVNEEQIKVTGEPHVRGIDPKKIHIYYDSSPEVITCSLDTVEEKLLKKYGNTCFLK